MSTFRKKLGPRMGALKEIGKNLVELAWLFFVAAQWLLAVVIPSFFVASLICLIVGQPLLLTLHDTALISFKGYFYTYLSFLVFAGFAFYYFLKICKRGEPTFHYKCISMALYLSILLMLTYKIELCEHQYILKNIRYSQTTVQLFDADTKRPLDEVGYIGPSSGGQSVLPTKYSTMFSPDGSYTIQLIDIKPMEIWFKAPGYTTQSVLVGEQEGEESISVYLKKEHAPELETKPVPEKEPILKKKPSVKKELTSDPNAPPEQ